MISLHPKSILVFGFFFWFSLAGGLYSPRVGFDCGDGEVVSRCSLCDGDDDCDNGADELKCSHVLFDCGNGSSVLNGLVCDGGDDCSNGADENNCPQEFFDCRNGRFVPNRYLCDRSNDCRNWADEMHCTYEASLSTMPFGAVTSMFLKEDANIQSPNFPQNYPHNLTILWDVSTVPGYRIKLDFIVKELEDSQYCRADRLRLYDGHELSSPSLGKYCRHGEDHLPNPVLSSSNTMVVHFTSDDSVSGKGFNLTLSTVCGGTLFAKISEKEFFSHPKFGDDVYGENIRCDWIIKSRSMSNVQIRFSDFNIGNLFQNTDAEELGCENSTLANCVQHNVNKENVWKDFVHIYKGPYDPRQMFVGNTTPPTITSRGAEMLIRFRSGNVGGYPGFRALYRVV